MSTSESEVVDRRGNQEESQGLPASLRSIRPLYQISQSYRQCIQAGDILSLADLAHALVSVESSLEIIKEVKSFDNHENSSSFDDKEESRRVLQVITEFKTLLTYLQNQILCDKGFNYDKFKLLICKEKDDIRVNIITAMAVYYRDRGEKEYHNTNNNVGHNKRKAGLFFHSAAIFFHNLILQYHESRKLTISSPSSSSDVSSAPDNSYYEKILANFNNCREKIKLCSQNLQQNLINEHFLSPKSSLSSSSSSSSLNSMMFSSYEICDDGKVVGEGGYGSVFVVRHRHTQVEFACKQISTLNMDFKKLGRLHREIAILKQVDHPNIVKLHEVFYDSECVYLLMELCKVGDLATFMLDKIKRPLREHETRRLLKDMIISIRYLHQQNILHCDLKLENFVLDCDSTVMEAYLSSYTGIIPSSSSSSSLKPTSSSHHHHHHHHRPYNQPIPSELIIKVTDFGLSKYSDEYDVPVLSGSIPYISPEVFAHEKYNEKCDNWAIGVLAFMMLTGDQPFQGRTLIEVEKSIKQHDIIFPPTLSADAVDLVKKFLAYDQHDRISLDEALEHKFFYTRDTSSTSVSSSFDAESMINTDVSSSTSSHELSTIQPYSNHSNESSPRNYNTTHWQDIAQSLQSYWSMCKFNKVLCKAVAFSLKPNQIADLRTIFNNIDKDRNGSVSMAELQTVLSDNCAELAQEVMISEEFQLLSRDNQEISYSDFIAAALIKRVCIDESQLLMTFAHLDSEHVGYLSFDAVRRAIGDYMTEDEVKEMIDTLDKDGDGRIDYHEFILHWRKLTIQKNKASNGKRLFIKLFNVLRAVNNFRTTKRSIRDDHRTSSSSKQDMIVDDQSIIPSSSPPDIPIMNHNLASSSAMSRSISSSYGNSSSRERYISAEHEVKSCFYRLNTMSCDLEDELGLHEINKHKRKISVMSSSESSEALSSNIPGIKDKKMKRVSFLMPDDRM